MSNHAAAPADRQKKSRRRIAVPLAFAAVAAVGATALSSTALFTDSDSVANNTFSTGSIDISATPQGGVGFQVSNMAPGDVAYKQITVKNEGSLALRYAVTSAVTDGDLGPVLSQTVKTGVTSCDAAGFADGSVIYGDDTLGTDATKAKVAGDVATGPQAGDRTLDADDEENLCVQVTLAKSASNDYQGGTATALYTFDAEQTQNNG